MHLSCSICLELLLPTNDVLMTRCGHSFHNNCLREWLKRMETCPQCRNKCREKSLIKVFFNVVTNPNPPEETATLLATLESMTLSLEEQNNKLKQLENKDAMNNFKLISMESTVTFLKYAVRLRDSTIEARKLEIEMLQDDRARMQQLQGEWRTKIEHLSYVDRILSSTACEVDEIIAYDENPRRLAVLVATLKRQLEASESKTQELREQIQSGQSDLYEERDKRKLLEDKLSTAERDIQNLEYQVERWEIKRWMLMGNNISDKNVGGPSEPKLNSPPKLIDTVHPQLSFSNDDLDYEKYSADAHISSGDETAVPTYNSPWKRKRKEQDNTTNSVITIGSDAENDNGAMSSTITIDLDDDESGDVIWLDK